MLDNESKDRFLELVETNKDYLEIFIKSNNLQIEEMRKQRMKDRKEKRIMLLLIILLSLLIPLIFFNKFTIELGVQTKKVQIETYQEKSIEPIITYYPANNIRSKNNKR